MQHCLSSVLALEDTVVLTSSPRLIPVTGMCGSAGEGLSQHLTRQLLKASQQKQTCWDIPRKLMKWWTRHPYEATDKQKAKLREIQR